MKRTVGTLLLAVAAGCASTTPPPRPAPPSQTPAPVASPTPTPAPAPTPAPIAPPPSTVAAEVGDDPIRVLLERSGGPIGLPQPGRAYRIVADGSGTWLWGPLEIVATHESAWQVGAWSSAEAAASASSRLGTRLGTAARVWSEPAPGGLVRVRVSWPAGDPADAAARLAAAGFGDAFRTSGGGTVRVTGNGGSVESSAELLLTPADAWPTVVGSRSYRGRFRIRLGDGDLLVINELDLEAYLRGVVPVEMGPYQFPELEALKAQAVAARTYAVAHLGDHDDEGWDICATPACQAYHGAGAEHRLSDRAIEETTGLIAAFGGLPIDAMYTSTCGGHTEDAAELFPERAQPYLVGVACSWDRPMPLIGDDRPAPAGDLSVFRRWLARRAIGAGDAAVGPVELVAPVARLCGGEQRPLPGELDLSRWVDALLVAGGLAETGALTSDAGVWRLLDLADLFDIPLPPTTPDEWRNGWHLEAAAAVLELRGVIEVDRGEAIPHPDGAAIYPRRGERSEVLPQPLPLFWRWGSAYGGVSSMRVAPGTSLERYRLGDSVLALVIVRSGGGGDADRRSAWRSWRRERSWEELSASLGEPELERLEVVRRGVSGRVVGLGIVDRSGRRRLVEGFEVRRVLDLPETLFEVQVVSRPDGDRLARFIGRGWGHGVGLCQNGAYGLARAGMDFEAILKHYYTGIELVDRSSR